jgi:hypothetical protein
LFAQIVFYICECDFVVIVKKEEVVPKIFEYLGIVIYFYSNEHEPIHCHGKCGEFESKAEFYLDNGKITEIKIKEVKGRKPLKDAKLKGFKDFLESYSQQIVAKWVDYFIYRKDVLFEKVGGQL